MYHDQVSKNVWRSPDEGKTWNVIGGVPMGDAYMVIEHPYDTRVVRYRLCFEPLLKLMSLVGFCAHNWYNSLQNNRSWSNLRCI